MVVLSAHRDVIKNNYRFEYKNGNYVGLLDNLIGVLVANLMLEDKSIEYLEKKGEIGLFFGTGEEWGLTNDFPKFDNKKDIIIVVDVASGNRYKGYDFALENISGFTDKEIKNFSGNLKWEGHKILVSKFDKKLDLEDESWKWIDKGFKVISFCIPIEGESWHKDNCKISITKLNKCKQGLKRLINYVLP